jgi:alkylated DNA repair dioxygenase AlkB
MPPVRQRARTTAQRPEGLLYQPELVNRAEEAKLVEHVEALDFREVVMRGQAARRTVRHFGYEYGYESWKLVSGDPIPEWLSGIRDRAARLAGTDPDRLVQALITRYPPGAGIGWHRDAPAFGSKVIGVSLASSCRMRFQRRTEDVRYLHELTLEPRSGYVLSGPARATWQHSIPATEDLRYSITFRTLRGGPAPDRPK